MNILAILSLLLLSVVFAKKEQQKILLISLDGFRWDFQKRGATPNLERVVREGVSARYVQNVFPTLTLPNHHSIVTGLYPGNHGIVGNDVYDKRYGKMFDMYAREVWSEATPIWATNEQQGHESGLVYWPGHNVIKAKYTADEKFADPYTSPPEEKIMPLEKRLDLVVDWLKKPNVTFLAFYYEEPDETAHSYGTDKWDKNAQKHLNKTISQADQFIGDVFRRLKRANLEDINVIIVGDHGHVTLSYKQKIYLDEIVDLEKYADHVSGTTCVFIYASKSAARAQIYEKLKRAENHYKVYLRDEIPADLHLKQSDRAPDILLLGDPGWAMLRSPKRKEWFEAGTSLWKIGDHGYHTDVRSMSTVFYAQGPAFKQGYSTEMVQLVDFYLLMCEILGIRAEKNDGKLERIRKFLRY